MLTYLLATDPATPADVLTHLASQPDLPLADCLALAGHPALPATAPLTVTHRTETDLHTAHTRHAHGLAEALAQNTHTPPDVARVVAADLYRTGSRLDTLRGDVLTLRTHLTPTTPGARAAAGATDPVAAYAQHLLDTEVPSGDEQRAKAWWPRTIDAFPHPLLTAAALAIADTTRYVVSSTVIRNVLTRTTRATPEHRYRAALLSSGIRSDIPDTAPDHVLRSLLTHEPLTCGWRNPHASDATLRVMLPRTLPHPEPAGTDARASIALHPNATLGLRTEIADIYGGEPWLTTLLRHLNTHGTALDVPLTDLLAAEAATDHIHRWAAATWARAPHAGPVTLAYAQALLALEAAQFPGTVRELLHTARTIAT